jgi:hypothetical protein
MQWADCIQTVLNGAVCGNIIYESKRTKRFDKKWIDKLRQDQQRVNAGAAVLVTEVLPDEAVNGMILMDGVVVCSYSLLPVVAYFTRMKLIALQYEQARNKNQQDKAGLLFQYLTSDEFRMNVEEIVKGFVSMKESIDKERRSYERLWKEREKQIEKVVLNTTRMYGAIKGIAGSAVKEIKLLEI